MSLFADAENFFKNNPQLVQLAGNTIAGFSSPKPAPKVVTKTQSTVQVAKPPMSTVAMLGISAAVIGVAVLAVMLFRKKRG